MVSCRGGLVNNEESTTSHQRRCIENVEGMASVAQQQQRQDRRQ